MPSDSLTRALLAEAHSIAIVGLSEQAHRSSYVVAALLQRNGYRIIPVNPFLSRPVLGEQPYAILQDVKTPIDIVAIFRRPEFVLEVVEAAIAIGVKTVWMPLGVVNHEAAHIARAAGLNAIMDRCIAIEHRQLTRPITMVY
jgi:hypothetical protein